MIGELRGQRLMRRIILGDHQQAARILVEPVHDAGPPHPANAGEALPQWNSSALTSVPV